MLWVILVIVPVGLLAWIVISPLAIEIDTRMPRAQLEWKSIGRVQIWHTDEWWLSIRILFYRKTIRCADIKNKSRKRTEMKPRSPRTISIRKLLPGFARAISTFKVEEWQMAIDTGNPVTNAQLYPINFLPPMYHHLNINFNNENYLFLKISHRPWKIILAFFR